MVEGGERRTSTILASRVLPKAAKELFINNSGNLLV